MMIDAHVHRSFRTIVQFVFLSLVAFTAVTCSDNTSPAEPRAGAFAIATRMASAAGIVDVSEVHVTLTRVADGTVVSDTVVILSQSDSTVEITLTTPLENSEEQFEVSIVLIDPDGGTVFLGGPVTVTASTGTEPIPVDIDLVYTGVGANAAGVLIVSSDTLVTSSDEISLSAVAFDSSETPIPGTPIAWRSLDAARVSVPQAEIGRVVAGAERGVARVVAQLLTGQADTVRITTQLAAANLLLESGSGQIAFADSLLELPLVTRVVAADAEGVEGVWVRYVVTQGSGSLSADSAISSADGFASVYWRLGAGGVQEVQASSAALPTANVVFTATATTPPQPAGPQIIFFGDSAGAPSLFRVNGDGSGLTLVEQMNGDYPQWSPSRERVVYKSFRNQVEIGAADGSGSATLTTTMVAGRPRFNSTGQRLAYSCAPSISEWPELCVIDDVSGPIASLTGIGETAARVFVMDSIGPDVTGQVTFAWDPIDSDQIFFFRDSLNASSDRVHWLYASQYDGSGMESLTPTYLEYQGTPLSVTETMEFSPDGQQMIFTGNGALYLINRDGTGLTRLTIGGDASNPEYDYNPRFSPDGQQIAFVRRIRYFNASATDVWVINTDGTNLRQLTTDQFPYTETRVTVDWSPDGTELVVVGLVDQPTDYSAAVYVIPATSSPDTYMQVRRRVGRLGDIDAINERHPVWRP